MGGGCGGVLRKKVGESLGSILRERNKSRGRAQGEGEGRRAGGPRERNGDRSRLRGNGRGGLSNGEKEETKKKAGKKSEKGKWGLGGRMSHGWEREERGRYDAAVGCRGGEGYSAKE